MYICTLYSPLLLVVQLYDPSKLIPAGGRFSGLAGGACDQCLTAKTPTIPLIEFSYTLQSDADLGAAAIKTCGRFTPQQSHAVQEQL